MGIEIHHTNIPKRGFLKDNCGNLYLTSVGNETHPMALCVGIELLGISRMVVSNTVLFHHTQNGEMIQFDKYVSRRLKPPEASSSIVEKH